MKISFNVKGIKLTVSFFLLAFGVLFWLNDMFAEFFIMFIVVVCHELSHAAIATGFGMRLSEIKLTPLGGQAKLDGFCNCSFKPEMEAVVAIVGPMSNLVFAVFGYVVSCTNAFNSSMIDFFIATNIILAMFNMLPVLPLDGGRIFRALLVNRFGFYKATNITMKTSKFIAVLMIIGGITGFAFGVINLNICFTGIFILMSYGKSKDEEAILGSGAIDILRRRVKLDNVKVIPSAMFAVDFDSSINDVIKQVKGSKFAIINVMSEDSKLLGTLTETQILDAAAEKGFDYCIGNLVESSYFPDRAG